MYYRRKNSIGSQEMWAQALFILVGCIILIKQLKLVSLYPKVRDIDWMVFIYPSLSL